MSTRNESARAKPHGRLLAAALTVVLGLVLVVGLTHFAFGSPLTPKQSLSHSEFASIPGVDGIAASSQMVYATTDYNCTQVWAVTPWHQVQLYASLPIPVSKCGEGAIAMGPAPCGCESWVVYVIQEGQVFEVSNWPTTVTLIATVTTSHVQQDWGMSYDQVGTFHHDLIVGGAAQGDIWLVNITTGNVTFFTSLNTHQIEALPVAPMGFGSYGGDIIVPIQLLNEVVAVSPTGVVSPIVGYSQAEGVAFPTSCSVGLLVANQTAGGIDLYPKGELSGLLSGYAFVNGEGDRGIAAFTASGSLTVIAVQTYHLEQIAFL
jgi:hypothetical protein